MNPTLPQKEIKKIAILRALQLGDMLCAIPAIRALRKAYPDAGICLLGLPWAKNLLNLFPQYFDRFIHFPGYEGLPEQESDDLAFADFVAVMNQQKFDLLLQMQGNGTVVNQFMHQLGAKYVAGFHNSKSYQASDLFTEYPNAGSEIYRHLSLMQHLGIPQQGTELEFPVTAKDEEAVHQLMLPILPKKYVCIHPGSRGAWRQWPPRYFAALADICIENGFTAVITGTNEEMDITREVMKCMKHPAIDVTGKTNLGAVAWLIQNAYMLIANCTGVSHIASATKTKSLVISMDGEPERWAPLNKELHVVIDWTKHPQFDKVLMNLNRLLSINKLSSVEI